MTDFKHTRSYLIPLTTDELEADKPTGLLILNDADEILTAGYFHDTNGAIDAAYCIDRLLDVLGGKVPAVTAVNLDAVASAMATVFELVYTGGAKKPAEAAGNSIVPNLKKSKKEFNGSIARRAGNVNEGGCTE